MPDHWHGLVELSDGESLASLMRRLKAVSASHVNLIRGSREPVWSAGFHDHALRSDDDLIGTARYIVANPIRAGLVRRVGEYPYWDSVWL